MVFFFFFQAEGGIRGLAVTGVQTCALPICNLKSDMSDNDVASLHRKAMVEVDKQKDAYRDKMRELEALVDGLRSDATSIQNKMFEFLESLNDK